ncbi:phage tail tube protein [Nocardia sp. NPDC004711]
MAVADSKWIGAGAPNSVTGGILVAPIGTTLPVNGSTAPGAAFIKLGYVSEDGVDPQGDRKSESIKDWFGDTIAQLQSEHSVRFGLTLYSVWDPDVLGEVFGPDNITVTAPTASAGTLITVKETGSVLPRRSWIFDMAHEGKKLRIVLPNAKISEVKEGKMTSKDLAKFDITIEAFKDSSSVKAYRYLDDGVTTGP